jgi:hypothetical protein
MVPSATDVVRRWNSGIAFSSTPLGPLPSQGRRGGGPGRLSRPGMTISAIWSTPDGPAGGLSSNPGQPAAWARANTASWSAKAR